MTRAKAGFRLITANLAVIWCGKWDQAISVVAVAMVALIRRDLSKLPLIRR